MAHVELSLTEAFVPSAHDPEPSGFATGVASWTHTVAAAAEPCLVAAPDGTVLAISVACCELLGLGEPAVTVGRSLLDDVLRLIDFTAGRGALSGLESDKIPPLLAMSSERLARGLMRVLLGDGTADVTVDAIATPLLQDGRVAASLTFFSPV